MEIWYTLMFCVTLSYMLDLLPTSTNLSDREKCFDTSYPLCGMKQTINDILSACSLAMSLGWHTWLLYKVLHHLAKEPQDLPMPLQ